MVEVKQVSLANVAGRLPQCLHLQASHPAMPQDPALQDGERDLEKVVSYPSCRVASDDGCDRIWKGVKPCPYYGPRARLEVEILTVLGTGPSCRLLGEE